MNIISTWYHWIKNGQPMVELSALQHEIYSHVIKRLRYQGCDAKLSSTFYQLEKCEHDKPSDDMYKLWRKVNLYLGWQVTFLITTIVYILYNVLFTDMLYSQAATAQVLLPPCILLFLTLIWKMYIMKIYTNMINKVEQQIKNKANK